MEHAVSKELIQLLRYAHGSFNLTVALLCFYQLRMGLKVRKSRLSGAAAHAPAIRHRRLGPVLVALGTAGFLAGSTLILLDRGRLLVYPMHFITGLLIASGLTAAFALSRRIRPGEDKARLLHRRIGITVAVLYLIQIFLGAGALL